MARNNFLIYSIYRTKLSLAILASLIVFASFGQETDCQEILQLTAENSDFSSPVFTCNDAEGKRFFKGAIKTDVCNDSLCELMELNVIWDLAGNYKKIDSIPGLPLTKI